MDKADLSSAGIPTFISNEQDSLGSFGVKSDLPPAPPGYYENVLWSYKKMAPTYIQALLNIREVFDSILSQILDFDDQTIVLDMDDFMTPRLKADLLSVDHADHAHLVRLKIHSIIMSSYRAEVNEIRRNSLHDEDSWVGPLPANPNKATE